MARIRNIKPSFFLNDEIAALPAMVRLAFPGLWCLADRAGRLEDRPVRIKAQVFPYDEIDMEKVLCHLAAAGFILRYEVEGNRYIEVINFEKHQSPHVKEAASTLPAPGLPGAPPRSPSGLAFQEPGACTGLAPGQPECSTPDQEGKGREGEGITCETDAFLPPPPVPGLPKGAGHPYSAEQIARLKAAMPEGNLISPQQVPYQLGVMLSRAVESNVLAPMVQTAWREMDPGQKVVWTCEAMRRVAHKAARYRFKDAAEEHIGKALEGGYDLLKDGWRPPAGITYISEVAQPLPAEMAGKPWLSALQQISKTPATPSAVDLMNLARALGQHDHDAEAVSKARDEGVIAACDWLWANQQERMTG